MIKRAIKSLLKAKLSPRCSFFYSDNSIVAEIDDYSRDKYFFVLSGNKYLFENGIAHIPYSKNNKRSIKNNKFRIQAVVFGRMVNVELQESNICFYENVFSLKGIKHKELLDSVIEIKSTSLENSCFTIYFNTVSLNDKRIMKVCILNDEFKILGTADVNDNSIVIENINSLFGSDRKLRIMPFSKDGYFSFVGITHLEQDFLVHIKNGCLYIEKSMIDNDREKQK